MKIETYIDSLVSYAMNNGLAEPVDHQVLTNRLLDLLRLDDYVPSQEPQSEDLEQILPSYFIRINKSTLANEHRIERFDAVDIRVDFGVGQFTELNPAFHDLDFAVEGDSRKHDVGLPA